MKIDKSMCFIVTPDRLNKNLQKTPEETKESLEIANDIMNNLRELFDKNIAKASNVWGKLVCLNLFLDKNHPDNKNILEIEDFLDSKKRWPTRTSNNTVWHYSNPNPYVNWGSGCSFATRGELISNLTQNPGTIVPGLGPI